jgi:uncharacterized cupredoxin-like copper-binding protein
VLRTGFTGFASRRAYLRLAAIILSVAAALSVAACGGDDDDDDGGSDQTAASTQATTGGGGGGGGETVQIGETEFALDPSEANVQAGEVTFEVTNDGSTVHDLEVEGQGVEEKTDLIEPGQSATLTVDLSQSGSYEMYCTVDSHREQGMEGEVTVQG